MDRTSSWPAGVDRNTITINYSGGVNDNISWAVAATEASGNTVEKTRQVLNPALE